MIGEGDASGIFIRDDCVKANAGSGGAALGYFHVAGLASSAKANCAARWGHALDVKFHGYRSVNAG